MPDVPVSDVVVEANELVISTHGRGFWILDNIGPLRQATPTTLAASAHLYTPAVAVRSGSGATLVYDFKAAPKRAILEILDSTGTVLRKFEADTLTPAQRAAAPAAGGRRGGAPSILPIAAGMNRVNWDLRIESIPSFPGMILWGAGTAGPAVPPATYTARLIADGATMTAPIVVKRNPRLPDVTDADLRAQFAFGKKVRDKTTEANEAVIAIRRVKAQLDQRLTKSDDAALKSTGATLKTNATGVEVDVYQVRNQSGQDPLNFPIKVNNRLANLLSMSERGDGPPGTYMPEIFDILSKELKGYSDRLQVVWKTDLAAVNRELARLKLPPLDPTCAKVEGCTAVP
jgi:hypothetical protein